MITLDKREINCANYERLYVGNNYMINAKEILKKKKMIDKKNKILNRAMCCIDRDT